MHVGIRNSNETLQWHTCKMQKLKNIIWVLKNQIGNIEFKAIESQTHTHTAKHHTLISYYSEFKFLHCYIVQINIQYICVCKYGLTLSNPSRGNTIAIHIDNIYRRCLRQQNNTTILTRRKSRNRSISIHEARAHKHIVYSQIPISEQ